MDVNGHDLSPSPVEGAIREWHEFVARHDAAIEEASKLRAENAYLIGQVDLLKSQKDADEFVITNLRQQLDEAKLQVTQVYAVVSDACEKLALGAYRRPGTKVLRRAAASVGTAAVAEALKSDEPVPKFLTDPKPQTDCG